MDARPAVFKTVCGALLRRPGWVRFPSIPATSRGYDSQGDSQKPQTVLKTAGLASTAVHQCPPEFGYYLADSKVVRPLPQLYSKLAVILAVSLAVNRSLRPAENYLIRIRWVAAACRHLAPACVHETTQPHGDGQRLSKEPCRRMSTSNHSSGTPSLIEADQIPS